MSTQEQQRQFQPAKILNTFKERSANIHREAWNAAWRISTAASLFLASCTISENSNHPETLPANTSEPPQVEFSPTLEEIILTPTSTLEPTTIPTETPTPTETIALPPPTETWMGEFLANKEGYDYSFENGQWLMHSKPLENGKTIDMFTFADGEWQPTYDTLPNHVNEYFGLDLEAVAHQFVRYELTTDSEGNSVRTLNPDDLANLRALAETRWEERKEHLGVMQLVTLFDKNINSLSIDGLLSFEKPSRIYSPNNHDERWEVLAAASTGSKGKDQVIFIGTKHGLIPMIIVSDSGLVRLRLEEYDPGKIENATQPLIENPNLSTPYHFAFSVPPSDNVKPNTGYTYENISLDYFFSYIRGAQNVLPYIHKLAESGYYLNYENTIGIIDKNNLIFVPDIAHSELVQLQLRTEPNK
jgi:hypothetical protein